MIDIDDIDDDTPRWVRRQDAWQEWRRAPYWHRSRVLAWVWDRTVGRYAHMPAAASPATALAWSQQQIDARATYDAAARALYLRGRPDPIPWITLPTSLQVSALRALSHYVRDVSRSTETRRVAAAAQTILAMGRADEEGDDE